MTPPPAAPAPSTGAAGSPAPSPQTGSKPHTPSSKGAKTTSPTHNTALRGVQTSFKQKTHAKVAGPKFKAAYNGAGPAIVSIVENAAAYFEGMDNPDVFADQAKSYARYQFNVGLLNEIFDGPVTDRHDDDHDNDGAESMAGGTDAAANANGFGSENGENDENGVKCNLLRDIARRVVSANAKEQAEEMKEMENRFRDLEDDMKNSERINMRLFQRVERTETPDQIETLKRDLKRDYGILIQHDPSPIKRRKVDKTLPRLTTNDDLNLVRFKSL